MGAHALGAAAYAARAAGLAEAGGDDAGGYAVATEVRWQVESMSGEVRVALRGLPPVGTDRHGPLGPGLLASGQLGGIIRDLQASLLGGAVP